MHVDPNEYYGGAEAALSLQDADEWAKKHDAVDGNHSFAAAQVSWNGEGLAASRSYSVALAPQIIYARSQLLTQLVSSKAFRQIEFQAVGSFFIFQAGSDSSESSLSRIPSTREDVFANQAIPARSKRFLMKFLKFVVGYDSEPQSELWKPRQAESLTEFLEKEFNLDSELQSYVSTLTLSPDGQIAVGDGLTAISRHLRSMGVFGPGFAAVYPKWGGLSEVAQVSCRASAVGGAIYMLGVGVSGTNRLSRDEHDIVEISLTNDVKVEAKAFFGDEAQPSDHSIRLSKLTAIVNAPLTEMFGVVIEGAPTPCAAVVAFPAGTVSAEDGTPSQSPIYALVHSSDAGECPVGQCIIYFSTMTGSNSKTLLGNALSSLLTVASKSHPAMSLWQMYYEQACGTSTLNVENNIGIFDRFTPDLAFNDSILGPVQQAWRRVVGSDAEDTNYMKFDDREGVDDEDDAFAS